MDFNDMMALLYAGLSAIEDRKIDEIEITREWTTDEKTEGVHVVLRRDTFAGDLNAFFNPTDKALEEE